MDSEVLRGESRRASDRDFGTLARRVRETIDAIHRARRIARDANRDPNHDDPMCLAPRNAIDPGANPLAVPRTRERTPAESIDLAPSEI